MSHRQLGLIDFSLLCFPKNLQKTRRQEGKEKFEAELETLQADNKSGEVCWFLRVFPNVADVGAFEAGLAAAREALATSRQSEQEAQAKPQVCYMPATRIVARFKQKVRKKLAQIRLK